MNIKRFAILITTFSLLFAVSVYAQDEVRERDVPETERIEEAEPIRAEDNDEETRVETFNRREQFQQRQAEAEQRRIEMLQRANHVRTERTRALETREARIVELRAEAAERLSERLQNRTEQFGERLNNINNNMTDAYLRQLDALDNIFERLLVFVERTSRVAGTDLDAVYEAGEHALNSINSAREAVLEQKAKVYTAEIESPETLGEALRGMIHEFRTDHHALRENHLFPAREAVRNMLHQLQRAFTGFNVSERRQNNEEPAEQETEAPEEEATETEEEIIAE